MSLVVNDIADFLSNNGIGSTASTIFIGHQPASPANCVTVLDTGGMRPDIDIPTKHPTFQILIRNTSFLTGRNLLETIRDLLHQTIGRVLTTDIYYYYIFALAEGGHIGRDEQGNEEFSINFEALIR